MMPAQILNVHVEWTVSLVITDKLKKKNKDHSPLTNIHFNSTPDTVQKSHYPPGNHF